jgi:hypothetical protein
MRQLDATATRLVELAERLGLFAQVMRFVAGGPGVKNPGQTGLELTIYPSAAPGRSRILSYSDGSNRIRLANGARITLTEAENLLRVHVQHPNGGFWDLMHKAGLGQIANGVRPGPDPFTINPRPSSDEEVLEAISNGIATGTLPVFGR